MASDMGWWCAVWFCVIGFSSASVVLNGQWLENTGWEVTCRWETLINDKLLAVHLFRNGIQYLTYRPEQHGQQFNSMQPTAEFLMNITCKLASPQGQRGVCITKMELYQNATEDTYKCEVSGEGPTFRLEHGTYTVFVPPSNAQVTAISESMGQETLRTLNCSSSGVPAPNVVWSVEGHKVPSVFSHTSWNPKTKLWDSWSTFNPQTEAVAKCTPVVSTKSGIVERGLGAFEWNGASWIGVSKTIVALALTLSFLR